MNSVNVFISHGKVPFSYLKSWHRCSVWLTGTPWLDADRLAGSMLVVLRHDKIGQVKYFTFQHMKRRRLAKTISLWRYSHCKFPVWHLAPVSTVTFIKIGFKTLNHETIDMVLFSLSLALWPAGQVSAVICVGWAVQLFVVWETLRNQTFH